jgi:uncharacterized membrane protein
MKAGDSDAWIRLNSIFWSVLASFSIIFVFRNIFGFSSAAWAALFFTLSPLAVYYAQEVRMYALMMFLGLWCFYFYHGFLNSSSPGRSLLMAAGAFLITELFLYSHGAGFLLLASLTIYSLVEILNRGRPWDKLLPWLVMQLAIVLFYLPWILIAVKVPVPTHLRAPGLEDIVQVVFNLILGLGRPDITLQWTAMIVAVAAGLLALIFLKGYRNFIFSWLVIPFIACAVISHFIRPIWHYRTLAYLLPFICLGTAMILTEVGRRFAKKETIKTFLISSGALLSSFVLSMFLVYQGQTVLRNSNYKEATAFVRQAARPGETIIVANQLIFWGWSWYFRGPGHVKTLEPNGYYYKQGSLIVITFKLYNQQFRLKKGRSYWFVNRFVNIGNPDPQIYTLEISKSFGNLKVERIRF